MVALRGIVAGSRIGRGIGQDGLSKVPRYQAVPRNREPGYEVEDVRPGAKQQNRGQNQGPDPPLSVCEQWLQAIHLGVRLASFRRPHDISLSYSRTNVNVFGDCALSAVNAWPLA